MKVHEIMRSVVVTVTPKTSFRELWQEIIRNGVHSLPVVDSRNTLLGIVAEEDLMKQLYPDYKEMIDDFLTSTDFEEMESKIKELSGLTASDVMGKRVIFTRPDTPVMRALSRMLVRNVRQLPVLSREEILVGMVSKGDVFDAIFRKQMGKAPHKSTAHKRLAGRQT